MVNTDIISRTQGMTSSPKGVEVDVEVVSLKGFPTTAREARARARALISAGVLPSAKDNIEDVTIGEISRLTEVMGSTDPEGRGPLTEAQLFTVEVKRN